MRYTLVFGLVVGFASTAFGAAWTQPSGAHYLKVWDRTLAGKAGTTASGVDVEFDELFVDTSLNVYFEYGVTDSFTLVASGTPGGYATYDGTSETYVGPLNLGARYGVPLGSLKLAVEGHYGYAPPWGDDPIAVATDNSGRTFFYTAAVETHRADIELQVGHPLSFGWTAASTGVRYYSADNFDPVIYGHAQLGYQGDSGLVVDGRVSWHQPLGDVSANNISGAGETRYVGFGVGLSYWFTDHWSIAAAFEGAVGYQANASTPSLILGFEHR